MVGGAAALLLVGGLYLLVRPQEDESPETRAGPLPAAAAVAPAQVLPPAPAAAAQPIADAGEAPRGATHAAAPASAALPRSLADFGRPVTLSGRIVDGRGSPVGSAEVIHVASPALVKQLDRKPIPFGPRLPWPDFLRTRSDESGRFVLKTFELPRPPDEPRPPVADGAWAPHVQPVPALAVLHPDFAAALHTCSDYREGDLDVGDIALTAGCTLAGRLVDERGAPIAGGEVGVSHMEIGSDDVPYDQWEVVDEILICRSEEDGRFALGSLWPGTIMFTIEAAGYVPQEQRFECRFGQVTDAGAIVLARGSSISGVVLDGQGRPLEGATVKARPSAMDLTQGATDTAAWEFSIIVRANAALDVEARSDARGAFELGTLDAEQPYTLLAGLEGHEVVKQADVPVGTRDVVLNLLPSAAVLVTVVDARTGEPVTGASATGRRLAGGSPMTAMDRSARLDVLAGDAALAAAAPLIASGAAADAKPPASGAGLLLARGLGPQRNTLTVSAEGFATTTIDLPPASAEEPVRHELALAREASISGTVVGADGRPVASASIEVASSQPLLAPLGGAKPRVETADGAGRFRIGALTAGGWRLTATAPGYARGEPQLVDVAAEQAVEVELTLVPGARISGIVLAPDGRPKPDCGVTALHASAPADEPIIEVTAQGTSYRQNPNARKRNYTAQSDAAGRFAIEALPAGRFEVTATPGAKAEVELPPGGQSEVVLQLRRPPTIRGRVTDADGPLAGAAVEASLQSRPGSWTDAGHTVTSAAGEYELVLSEAGDCILRAELDDERAPPRRVMAEWDVPQVLDLAFGTARAAGQVVAAGSGDPIAGAYVKLIDRSGQERDGLGPNLGHFYTSTVKTGADGRFEARRLQPGRYKIEVSRKGWAPVVRVPVELPAPGADDGLLFELAPGAKLGGTVRPAGGGALPVTELKVSIGGVAGGEAFERFATLEPDGRFTRGDLPAGPALVRLLRVAAGTAATGTAAQVTDAWAVVEERSCVLEPGATTTVDFVLAQ